MSNINLPEQYGLRRTQKGLVKSYDGEVEIIFKDRNGRVLSSQREMNIIKLFGKEIFAHRLPYHKVWDPNAGTGSGECVENNLDLDEFAAKYIMFGASFDANGNPLDSTDTR